MLAVTFGAVGTLVTMLGEGLDAIKDRVAVATAIFVSRHAILHI